MKITLLRIPGYLWSLPYGLLSLLGAAVFWACGWVVAAGWREGALELVCRGPLVDRITRPRAVDQEDATHIRVWGGFTPAWVIFFWSVPSPSTRAHEKRHVQQVLWLGLLYWPVYGGLLLALASWWFARNVGFAWGAGGTLKGIIGASFRWAYQSHPLEKDARRAAAEAALFG